MRLRILRFFVFGVLAFGLGACSRSDEDHAREQARQTEAQLKHDSQKAFHAAEAEAHKANVELTHGAEKVREKTRQALDQPAEADHDRDTDRTTR